jgi:hypothetical protein
MWGEDGDGTRPIKFIPGYSPTWASQAKTDSISDYEMILASMKAAAAARPPITIVCDALRNGFAPV